MRKAHSIALMALFLAAICGSAFAESTAPAAPGVVNINTADVTQLSYLPRVGVKAAQRIVDYRQAHGPFHKTSDLMQVKGFGEKSFSKLSAYLTVDGKTTLSSKVSSPRKPRASRRPANTASK